MAYQTKLKHKKQKIPKGYFEERELRETREKYKGKLPPITEISRLGTRRTFQIQKQVHRKGEVVYYKDKIGVVKEVSKQGLHIQLYKQNKKTEFIEPVKKIKFVKEKNVEHQVYPAFLENVPLGTIAPYGMGYMHIQKVDKNISLPED